MTPEAILKEIRRRRHRVHATQADIARIQAARASGRWAPVHQSRLYRLHSAEYCELLEVTAH